MPTVVGIHLRGTVLRRAEVRGSGRQMVVVTSAQPLPDDRQAAGPSGSVSAVPAGSDETRTIASMPMSDTMSRHWRLPETDDETFRQMVVHRLEADLPIPIDELTWGYRKGPRRSSVVGRESLGRGGLSAEAELPAENGSPAERGSLDDRREVFAQAVRTNQVARYMALLSGANVPVDTLTTEAEALGALYRHGLDRPGGVGTEALVLATPDDWLVAVLVNGMVRSLRRMVVERVHLDRACRQCTESIEAQVSRHDLRRVMWCGPVEQDDARNALAERLGVAVEPVEPAARLVGVDGKRISAAQLATFGPAIGLALAGVYESDRIIRLVSRDERRVSPHRQRIERLLSHPWRWTGAAAAMVIVASTVHVGAIAWEARKMRRLVDDLERAGSPLTAMQPKIRAMQRLRTYRIEVEGVMADLCRPIPDSIVISSIRLSRDRRLEVKGTAKDPKAIFALADALRKSDRFGTVNPERTEPAQGGGFTISAELVGVNTLPSFAGRGRAWR